MNSFLFSCVEKTEFNGMDLDWMIPYNENQLLLFKSLTTEKIDSIRITKKEVFHPRFNPIAQSKIRHTAQIWYEKVEGNSSNKEKKGLKLLEMYKDNDEIVAYPIITLKGTSFIVEDHEIFYQTIGLSTTDRVFDEVVILAYEPLEGSEQVDDPMIIFWDKNEGILKYITNSGEEWERINLNK